MIYGPLETLEKSSSDPLWETKKQACYRGSKAIWFLKKERQNPEKEEKDKEQGHQSNIN